MWGMEGDTLSDSSLKGRQLCHQIEAQMFIWGCRGLNKERSMSAQLEGPCVQGRQAGEGSLAR